MFFCVVMLVLPLEKWRKNSRDKQGQPTYCLHLDVKSGDQGAQSHSSRMGSYGTGKFKSSKARPDCLMTWVRMHRRRCHNFGTLTRFLGQNWK